MSDFVHLHLHTDYSMLDGACDATELCKRAKVLEMPAVAMTDHGNIFGAVHFFNAAKDAGIKPIIGCESARRQTIGRLPRATPTIT
jgi:DNA polymerase-3 subunit alpha